MTDIVAPSYQHRYSNRPLPPYAYIPGQTSRPDPGHTDPIPEGCDEHPAFLCDRWYNSADYRYGIDLLNFGFWWESHEVFEKLWHRVGPKSAEGNFFQALIQLAAAQVKRHMGNNAAAMRLVRKAADRFVGAPRLYMGIDVTKLRQDIASSRFITQGGNIRIELNLPDERRMEENTQNLTATP